MNLEKDAKAALLIALIVLSMIGLAGLMFWIVIIRLVLVITS